jgi:hypothetical protein
MVHVSPDLNPSSHNHFLVTAPSAEVYVEPPLPSLWYVDPLGFE